MCIHWRLFVVRRTVWFTRKSHIVGHQFRRHHRQNCLHRCQRCLLISLNWKRNISAQSIFVLALRTCCRETQVKQEKQKQRDSQKRFEVSHQNFWSFQCHVGDRQFCASEFVRWQQPQRHCETVFAVRYSVTIVPNFDWKHGEHGNLQCPRNCIIDRRNHWKSDLTALFAQRDSQTVVIRKEQRKVPSNCVLESAAFALQIYRSFHFGHRTWRTTMEKHVPLFHRLRQ